MEKIKCCTTSCDLPLDRAYWDLQYENQTMGWDLGYASPPIKSYVDSLTNKDLRILIPGCGSAYEAEYLVQKGFKDITLIDISPILVEALRQKFEDEEAVKVIEANFFEHNGEYDLILEQTFFCALKPNLRQQYVFKMYELLAPGGFLAGLLFDREFENSPPFGGSRGEYQKLFSGAFLFLKFDTAIDSIPQRQNSEVFLVLQKSKSAKVSLYGVEGITCKGCSGEIKTRMAELDGVENLSISSDFKNLMLVTDRNIDIDVLRTVLAYDEKYLIKTLK